MLRNLHQHQQNAAKNMYNNGNNNNNNGSNNNNNGSNGNSKEEGDEGGNPWDLGLSSSPLMKCVSMPVIAPRP